MFKCNDVKQVFAVAYVNKLRAKAAAELKVKLHFCGCERRKKKENNNFKIIFSIYRNQCHVRN